MENEDLQTEGVDYSAADSATRDEMEFKEFKRLKRQEEAAAMIARIEGDFLSEYTDKSRIRNACKDFDRAGVGAIIVLPAYVKPCVSFLGKDPKCGLIAAISYPHGCDVTEVKTAATKRAVKDGVDEVEVCAPTAIIKDGNFSYFKKECKKLKKAARNRALRIVFDCAALSDAELTKACQCAADCGVNMLRLNNLADVQQLTAIKTAIKDKCLLKVDGGDDFSSFQQRVVLGAQSVASKNVSDVVQYLLAQIDREL
jgi:deoxyribose-phosphate aldolase